MRTLPFLLIPCLSVAADVRYTCPGGETFSVNYQRDKSPARAVLVAPDKPPLVLPEAVSSSGTRYSDGFTVLWTQGEEAMIESGTLNVKGCKTAPALQGRWTLSSIAGNPVTIPRPAYVEFHAESNRAAGLAGCNQFTSIYELSGETLRFEEVTSTQMACPEPAMGVELRFLKALATTVSHRVEGSTLTLLDASGTPLATLRRA